MTTAAKPEYAYYPPDDATKLLADYLALKKSHDALVAELRHCIARLEYFDFDTTNARAALDKAEA